MVSAEELVNRAVSARERAYAPYSNYRVGAALLTVGGAVYVGCNVENASYPATICAERVALTSAIADGQRDFVAIAVATRDGGTPCGICRQVMAELGAGMEVYIAAADGGYRTTSVQALLPDAFSADSL
jgi:cytidine deaminase